MTQIRKMVGSTFARALAAFFVLSSAAQAGRVYYLSRTVGSARVSGFIQTDGTIGRLSDANLVDWNLWMKNGFATLNLTGPLSGNNSLEKISVSPSAIGGNVDFTADDSNLFFDFSGSDGGYVVFQAPPLSSGKKYYCLETASAPANTCGLVQSGLETIDIVAFNDPSFQSVTGLTGKVIIGSVNPVPPPSSVVYYVSRTVGSGNVSGFIRTDGTMGRLSDNNLVDWNLVMKNGATTLNLTGPLSGNNSLEQIAVSPSANAGNLDLTADANNLFFDFSGSDGGYVSFQAPPISNGKKFYCLETAPAPAHTCGLVQSGLEAINLIDYNDPSFQSVTGLTGRVIIGSVNPAPEPSSFVLFGAAAFTCLTALRFRVRL